HARSEGGEKNVSAVDAEPLDEWERELLAQSGVQQQNAPAEQSGAAETPAAADAPDADAPPTEEPASGASDAEAKLMQSATEATHARTGPTASEAKPAE